MPVMLTPELIKAAKLGDRQAFRQIVEGHQQLVYAVAMRMVNNEEDAEDICQEVFVSLWRNLEKYREEMKLSTWLYKIATNRCLDFLKSGSTRRRRVHSDLEEQKHLTSISSLDGALEQQDFNKWVQEAAATLPEVQRAVFVLRDLQGLETEEVCQALDMSPNNVKSNLFHARQKVAERLKEFYQTNDRNFL